VACRLASRTVGLTTFTHGKVVSLGDRLVNLRRLDCTGNCSLKWSSRSGACRIDPRGSHYRQTNRSRTMGSSNIACSHSCCCRRSLRLPLGNHNSTKSLADLRLLFPSKRHPPRCRLPRRLMLNNLRIALSRSRCRKIPNQRSPRCSYPKCSRIGKRNYHNPH